MNQKKLYTVLFLLHLCLLKAQVFSLEPGLGINACQVHGDSYSGYDKVGLFAGTSINARLSDTKSFLFGFYFSQKGSRKNPNYKSGNYDYYRLNLTYIEAPFMFKYYSHGTYFVTVGGSIAYLVNASEDATRSSFSAFGDFRPLEGSLCFGLGKNINQKFRLEVRCSNSIFPVHKFNLGTKIFYPNPLARLFYKGLYNNVLGFFVSYNIEPKKKTGE